MQSFTEDLGRAMGIINYKGCLIFPKDGKFYVMNKPFDTIEKAKERIDFLHRLFHVLNVVR